MSRKLLFILSIASILILSGCQDTNKIENLAVDSGSIENVAREAPVVENPIDTTVTGENGSTTESLTGEALIRKYYELLSDHKFQEVVDMTYEPTRDSKGMIELYKGMREVQLGEIKENGNTYTFDAKMFDEDGKTEDYVVNKEIVYGKVKHVSSVLKNNNTGNKSNQGKNVYLYK